MSDLDDDLQRRLRRFAEEISPEPGRGGQVIRAARTRRRLAAVGAGLMAILLIGGVAGGMTLVDGNGSIEPAPGPERSRSSARYFFEVHEGDASASGRLEVDWMQRELCLEVQTRNIKASHLVFDDPSRPAGTGRWSVAFTFFDPDDGEEGSNLPPTGTHCFTDEQLERLEKDRFLRDLVDHPDRFRIDFHRGPNDDPGLIAELKDSPDDSSDPQESRSLEDAIEAQGGTIRLEVIPQSVGNGKVTKIVLVNDSDAPVGYGYDTTLEQEAGGQWRPLRRNGHRCAYLGILLSLKPGEETDARVGPLSKDCAVLPLAPGDYRVTKIIELQSGDRLPLTVAFRVAPPADEAPIREFVTRFLQARNEGAGAEHFLGAEGWPQSGPAGEPAPLYLDPPLRDFGIAFVDGLADGTYEVGVSLISENRTTGETLFVRERKGGFVISGVRPGLQGP